MEDVIKVNSIVKGQVTGIERYGIFVELNHGYVGLIHISEISEMFVYDIHKYVELGEVIYSRVLEVDNINKKVKLSIKDINYKETPVISNVLETRLGFLPLKEHLPIWIEEKLKIYK